MLVTHAMDRYDFIAAVKSRIPGKYYAVRSIIPISLWGKGKLEERRTHMLIMSDNSS